MSFSLATLGLNLEHTNNKQTDELLILMNIILPVTLQPVNTKKVFRNEVEMKYLGKISTGRVPILHVVKCYSEVKQTLIVINLKVLQFCEKRFYNRESILRVEL